MLDGVLALAVLDCLLSLLRSGRHVLSFLLYEGLIAPFCYV